MGRPHTRRRVGNNGDAVSRRLRSIGSRLVAINAAYMDSSLVSARIRTRDQGSDAVIYPACAEAAVASGHDGHPRTESQSVKRDLTGSTAFAACLGAGPTGHAIGCSAVHLDG